MLALGYLLMRGRWRSRSQIRRTLAVTVLIALVIGSIAGSALMHKMSTLPNADSGNRLIIWRASVAAIRESPWLGWGLGSFTDIYAVNQPPEIVQPNDKAHSDTAGNDRRIGHTGRPRGDLRRRAAVAGLSAQRLASGVDDAIFRPPPSLSPGVAILHSTVDFSLQIPAIGFMVSAVLGNGMGSGVWHQRGAPPALYFPRPS